MNEKQHKKAREALLRAYDAIGRHGVADACKVAVQTTYKWDVCPSGHALMIEAVAGVPASWLRPDLYPGLIVTNNNEG